MLVISSCNDDECSIIKNFSIHDIHTETMDLACFMEQFQLNITDIVNPYRSICEATSKNSIADSF